jgi:tetratricopeptide (TPR) repeat protein
MPDAPTFDALARALAAQGAASSCAAQACALAARARLEPPLRAEALREGARGLREAARILAVLSPGVGVAPFRPVGLRGAVAAGHLAIASGHAGDAELIGGGVAEAAPRSAAGLRLVAQALFVQGKFRLAVRAIRGALAIDPDDPLTRSLHAEALWFAGERIAARAALALLRSARPDDPLAAALAEAFRSGALDGVGRLRCG